MGGCWCEKEEQRTWEDYFENLYNTNTQEQITVHICGFSSVRRSNHFGREPVRRTEVDVRVGKLRNGKDICKDGGG